MQATDSVPFAVGIRRLGAQSSDLYVQLVRGDLERAGFGEKDPVRAELPNGVSFAARVRTRGATPWLGPRSTDRNAVITEKLRDAGYAHGDHCTVVLSRVDDPGAGPIPVDQSTTSPAAPSSQSRDRYARGDGKGPGVARRGAEGPFGMKHIQSSIEALKADLRDRGSTRVVLTAWDPFILGATDRLETEPMSAAELARRELQRWRSGRFPSVVLAAADAVFSKQKKYMAAVRTCTRPFAQHFATMTPSAFCAFDRDNAYRLTFDKEPRADKWSAHLAPEGRMRSIYEVCDILRKHGIETVEQARQALALDPAGDRLGSRLVSAFGFGDAMLANLRMNVGVLTLKLDVHVRRVLAEHLGLDADAPTRSFENVLDEYREELGFEPFEIDQILWYTEAAAGRVD